MLVSFVFSFKNEEDNLRELIRRVKGSVEMLEDIDYELIFVNDVSTDKSLELLIDENKKDPKIKIINMSRNFGVTPCVIAGMKYSKGDAVVYMDSDLQDPPELVPEMINKFKNGADVVHTTRTHRDGESAIKMWITKKAYQIINLFSDIELPENTGDFKLYSRRVIDKILSLKEYDPYIRGIAVWVGYNQEFIYYRREARFAGETHMPLFSKGPIKEFIRGITAYSAVPLYISFFIGVFATIFSIFLAVYVLIAKFIEIAEPGSASVLIAISFFGGLIMITNGLIGLYVARIYNETKQRPKYIVQDTIGFSDDNSI
jgi:dolichol-phosphate mannosyltransferase